MDSLLKRFSLFHKNSYEAALIKLTWAGGYSIEADKYFNRVFSALMGQDSKVDQDTAIKVFNDYISDCVDKKWVKQLKSLILLHYMLNLLPESVGEFISANSELNTLSQFPSDYYFQSNENNPKDRFNLQFGQNINFLEGHFQNGEDGIIQNNDNKSNAQSKQKKPNNENILGNLDNFSVSCAGQMRKIPMEYIISSKLALSSGGLQELKTTTPLHLSHKSHSFKNSVYKTSVEEVHSILCGKYSAYVQILGNKLSILRELSSVVINDQAGFSMQVGKLLSLMELFVLARNMQRELETSLSTFCKVELTQLAVSLISDNLMQAASVLNAVVIHLLPIYSQQVVSSEKDQQASESQPAVFEDEVDFIRFYEFFEKFVIASRNIKEFNCLSNLIVSDKFKQRFSKIPTYELDKSLNKQLELKNLQIKKVILKNNNTHSNILQFQRQKSKKNSTKLGILSEEMQRGQSCNKNIDIMQFQLEDSEASSHGELHQNVVQLVDDTQQKKNLKQQLKSQQHEFQEQENVGFKQNGSTIAAVSTPAGNAALQDCLQILTEEKQEDVSRAFLIQGQSSNSNSINAHGNNGSLQYQLVNSQYKVQSKKFYNPSTNPLSFLQPSMQSSGHLIEVSQPNEQEVLMMQASPQGQQQEQLDQPGIIPVKRGFKKSSSSKISLLNSKENNLKKKIFFKALSQEGYQLNQSQPENNGNNNINNNHLISQNNNNQNNINGQIAVSSRRFSDRVFSLH